MKMEFEDSKWLPKIRGIIYHKIINIFASKSLDLSATIDPNMRERKQRDLVTMGGITMHTKVDILAEERHKRD